MVAGGGSNDGSSGRSISDCGGRNSRPSALSNSFSSFFL